MRIRVKVYLDPHDLWLGVYWTRARVAWVLPEQLKAFGKPKFRQTTTIYLCPFFCFVIRLTIEGRLEA